MKASQMQVDRNLSYLFKGPFGFAKTLAAASFAVSGKVYIAYFDKKKPIELEWFKRFGKLGEKILDNIEFDIFGAQNANQYLNKIIDIHGGSYRCDTFVTDSVTNLTAAAVNWSLGFRDPKGAKKDPKNPNAVQLIPDFDEYKVETSLVSQALDICKMLPCNIIWTAHPLPTLKVEGSGTTMKVSKTNSIVTYGSKVAGMIPGNFTEIYHFSKSQTWGENAGEKYLVSVRAIGDEFAKTAIFDESVQELDITNKLFYQVWQEAYDKQQIRNQAHTVASTQVTETKPTIEWKPPHT